MACEHEGSIEADGLTECREEFHHSLGRMVGRPGRAGPAMTRIAAIRQPPGKHFVLF
jgi:hypothetical protein